MNVGLVRLIFKIIFFIFRTEDLKKARSHATVERSF